MAMYWDPFRELDRLAAGMLDSRQGPRVMPIDLHRDGDHYVLSADLPGVDPGSIDVDVDGQLLTIRAERTLRVLSKAASRAISAHSRMRPASMRSSNVSRTSAFAMPAPQSRWIVAAKSGFANRRACSAGT